MVGFAVWVISLAIVLWFLFIVGSLLLGASMWILEEDRWVYPTFALIFVIVWCMQ